MIAFQVRLVRLNDWMGSMNRLFRPVILVGASLLLVAGLALFVFLREPGTPRPVPLEVPSNGQEIAFLYPATSQTTWQRFVLAVRQAALRLQSRQPDLRIEEQSGGEDQARTPQLTLRWGGKQLVFRWYKLTSDWRPTDWVSALIKRRPPPLAIIGGSSTYWARELAIALQTHTQHLEPDSRPLLLLTTATAEKVNAPEREEAGTEDDPFPGLAIPSSEEDPPLVDLHALYPRRTFRFCFTNRQMATSVTRFIFNRLDLRPDNDPAYLAQWLDDSFSRDLVEGYQTVLGRRATELQIQQWLWISGCIAAGTPPAMLASWHSGNFRHDGALTLPIDSSVGSFNSPNPSEARAVRQIMDQLRPPSAVSVVFPVPLEDPGPGTNLARPNSTRSRLLLAVTGQAQPSRRFLRDLARSAPDLSRRFVVAAGDTINFNTIFRDRQVAWPIQDLPFPLVFFSHQNPIDESLGFRRQQPSSATDDLLLFRDLAEALALAFMKDGNACSDSDQLRQRLFELRLEDSRITRDRGGALFKPNGRREDGAGEHVVFLQPFFEGERVLPRAKIEVWSRQTDSRRQRHWAAVGLPIEVSYVEEEARQLPKR